MTSATQRYASCTLIVAALLVAVPVQAAVVVGSGGKPVPRGTGQTLVIGEAPDAACTIPPGSGAVVFNLAPEIKLVDAIAWISSITCKPFSVRDTTLAEDPRLTMVAPERITPGDAYRLFVAALDSVGLRVEPSGKFLRIVDTGATSPRIAAADGLAVRSVVPEPYVSALVRLQDLSADEQKRLSTPRPGEACDCAVSASSDTVVITDLRSNIERLLRRPILLGR
jgi:general secretion pathway protein D